MAVTMTDVRRWLDADEPDYEGARRTLGADAAPHLRQLILGTDLALASKATYLASLTGGGEALPLLQAAHARGEPVLSVAAAAGIRNLSQQDGAQLFEQLHADPDPGVRKVALKSGMGLRSPQVAARYQALASGDPEPFIRALAAQAAATMRAP